MIEKAKELIEILQKHPEAEVIIAVDGDLGGGTFGIEQVEFIDNTIYLQTYKD